MIQSYKNLYQQQQRKLIPLFILILFIIIEGIVILSESPANARTIALVYDDSGSMQYDSKTKQEFLKWAYANYAAQSLTTLLKNDDYFITVLMSKPDIILNLETGANIEKTLENIKDKWRYDAGWTPYESVTKAMKVLEVASNKTTTFDKNQQDWLIVTTDGAFQVKVNGETKPKSIENLSKDEVNKLIKIPVDKFIKDTEGRVRIVFLLIGKKADTKIPAIWKNIAPKQVDIIKAEGERDISVKMEEIAALINGRDNGKSIETDSKGNKIQFTSKFPINRITVFEQAISGSLAKVQNIIFPDNAIVDVYSSSQNIKIPQGSITGRVTNFTSNSVMPSGSYVVVFDTNVEGKTIQLLLDTAVDFKVMLNPDGIDTLCEGEPISVNIQFVKAGSKEPILLTDEIAKKLYINVMFGEEEKNILFDSDQTKLIPAEFKVEEGKQTISVEARYPGYFHFKSNVFTIYGTQCTFDADISLSRNDLKVPQTYSNELEPISENTFLEFNLKGDNKTAFKGGHNIAAIGIPPGVIIDINGKSISKDNPSITEALQQGVKLPINVMRNNQYKEQSQSVITMHFVPKDQKIQWNNASVKLNLIPVNKKITFEPVSPNWTAKVNALDKAEPYKVNIKADGEKIPDYEFKNWEFDAKTSERLKLAVIKDEKNSAVNIYPNQYALSTGLTSTGNISFDLTGVSRSGVHSHKLFLKIEDVSFTEKWLPFILKLLLFLFLMWWIIGIVKKPRFAKNACVTYRCIRNRVKSKPMTEDLASGWFSRYIIPYIPEKKTVQGITFTPGTADNFIVISKDQSKEGISIGGITQEHPWKKDLRLLIRTDLEVHSTNKTEYYAYE